MHNGYTNYYTWVTALWLENTEANYNHYRGLYEELAEGRPRRTWRTGTLCRERLIPTPTFWPQLCRRSTIRRLRHDLRMSRRPAR